MGNLIKVLGKDLENSPHFFLDFESKSHAQRLGGGKRVWLLATRVAVLLKFGLEEAHTLGDGEVSYTYLRSTYDSFRDLDGKSVVASH